jgi:dTDP-4-dehydrorhamnose reductase
MTHILLLGGSGYVGTEFVRQITARGHRLTSLGRANCDVYNVEALTREISAAAPDYLINCAGYTGKPNVDACELDKTNCLAGNAILPGVISTACKRAGIHWGHVSSGCIYTGSRADGSGFTEDDAPNFSFRQNNCSFYSGTKALGEEILQDDANCYIWRLRIPFSHVDSSRNYLSKVMRYSRLLEAENSLSHLTEFVAAALDSFELKIPYGIYNLTNPGSVKTSEVVQLIQQAGLSDKSFEFFDSESDFMTKAAKTPRSNCVMNSTKAVSAGLKFRPVHDALTQTLAQWIWEK